LAVPSPVKRVEIPKPGSTKKRILGVPCVRDRVLQQALKMELEPLFESEFSDSSFGYRPGRSQRDAVAQAQALVNTGRDWVVDLDRFFKTAGEFIGDADLRSKDWTYHNMQLQRQSGLEMRAIVRQSKDLTWAWVFEDEQTSLRPQGYRHRRMNWTGISRTHQQRYQELVGDRYNPAMDTAPRRYPRPFKNLEMSLEDLRPNTSYRIEFWETWGSDEVTATLAQTDRGGNLTVKLPVLTRDLAVRIFPQND
jgi:hypothetical protein